MQAVISTPQTDGGSSSSPILALGFGLRILIGKHQGGLPYVLEEKGFCTSIEGTRTVAE